MSTRSIRALSIAGATVPMDGNVYIIAKAGVSRIGDVSAAHQLVNVAASSGADAIKFQTYVPSLLVSSGARTG